jgi:CheY-like chemotaxis protein
MKRVLIVDDEQDIRDALSDVMECEGYQVFTAENGKQGFEILVNTPPDVILLDLMMPIMDGREFLRIKESLPELASIPVIVMSASGQRVQPMRGAYLHKPVSLDQLLPIASKYAGLAS